MAIPAVPREYTPGSCRNSEIPWDIPLGGRWGPNPLHWVQSNSVFPIKHVRSFNVLDGTPESPQDHCHKTRGTLMSPQECKIAQCSTCHLEMKPISPSLAPWLSRVPQNTVKVANFISRWKLQKHLHWKEYFLMTVIMTILLFKHVKFTFSKSVYKSTPLDSQWNQVRD